MKIKKLFCLAICLMFFAGTNIFAEVRSSTIGGATGLITTPTAHTSWEEGGNLGLDLGYHYINDFNGSHTPKAALTLFNRWEIGGTYDIQGTERNDMLIHSKLRFIPWSGSEKTAVAIGGNFQSLKGPVMSDEQIYMAVTYPGDFFGWAAETSFVIGKTFGDGTRSGDIDFSMGFDLQFFPNVFKGAIHWVNDFANYSYSLHALGANASRGIFNTGLRIAPLKFTGVSKIAWKIDILMLDAMDDNRAFSMGTSVGFAF